MFERPSLSASRSSSVRLPSPVRSSAWSELLPAVGMLPPVFWVPSLYAPSVPSALNGLPTYCHSWNSCHASRPSPSKSLLRSVGSRALGHGFLPGYGYAREFRSSADWYSQPSDRPSVSVSARHGSVPMLFSRPLLSESLSSSPPGLDVAAFRHCS